MSSLLRFLRGGRNCRVEGENGRGYQTSSSCASDRRRELAIVIRGTVFATLVSRGNIVEGIVHSQLSPGQEVPRELV